MVCREGFINKVCTEGFIIDMVGSGGSLTWSVVWGGGISLKRSVLRDL